MNDLHDSPSRDWSSVIPSIAPPRRSVRVVSTRSLRWLKWGIWGYFLLLILEGALRKWFLPGLAAPLLIVRDPLVLGILILALKWEVLPGNLYVVGMMLIGIVGMITAILIGHGNLSVAVFGGRIFLLHFPLIFVMGAVFTRDDVVKMSIVTLWIAIPMTLLSALQFYSPQSAWVNRGVGGDTEGAGFSGALDFFRPPGTFSFTSGNTSFYSLVAAIVLYFWLSSERISRWLLIAATIGLMASIPLSISRTLFFQVIISVLFAAVAVVRKPKFAGRLGIMVGGAVLVLLILSQTRFFGTALEAFTTRFENASADEGGIGGTLIDRFLGGMLSSITGSSRLPFFGYGVGMGTNVGSMLLSGQRNFLIAEEEWGRVIGELGLLLGLSVILMRVSLTLKITLAAYRKLSVGDLLPWMLLSDGMLLTAQGGWAQPTSLGFCTLIGGLMLASLREPGIPQKLNYAKTRP